MLVEEAVNPRELVMNLRQEGVKLWEESGKLKFKAPKGVLTQDKIEQLRSQKDHILELLKNENHSVQVVPDLANRHDYFPLTDVQAAYLLGRNKAFEYGGVACHLYMEFEYDTLNVAKVESVWNDLIANHEMLRAEVSPEGHQYILREVPHFFVDFHDLQSHSEEKVMSELSKVREEMSNRMYQTDKWPLFGIGVSATPNGSLLHFSMEFLIADWASMLMIIREFESRYFLPEHPIKTPELSFRDYLIAERGLKNTLQYDQDKSYWNQRIPQLPPAPILPKAKKEDSSSGRFERRQLKLDLASWNNLKHLAQQYGVTPTVTVLTAYAQVLERWSRNNHFCLNLTVLNRLPLHQEVNDIVGDFTSVSLLEIDCRVEEAFVERAKTINSRLFEDLDHRLFTGIEVIREVTRQYGKERALMPFVFTSAIGLNNNDGIESKGSINSYGISQTPQVFMDCQAMDTEEGLYVYWDVRAGIFPENMVDDMFEVFKKLICQLSYGDDIWRQNAHIALPSRQEQERAAVNDTRTKLANGLLHLPILSKIDTQPDAIAVVDTDQTWNYRQLGLAATAIGNELKKLGCKPGERVAITIPKSVHQVSAVLGVLSAQATYVPIDVTQPEERRKKIVQNAGIRFVLISSKTNVSFSEDINLISVDSLPLPDQVAFDCDYNAEQPAYVIYTSGSTGQPKGVVISHSSASNTINDINSRFNITSKDSILALAQLGFDLSVYDLFGVLAAGGKLVFPQPDRQTDPSHWVALMHEHKVTIWDTVPALMQMLVTYLDSEKEADLPAFRLALLSGDWIPLLLPDRLKKRLPKVQLISLGGATEASIWSIHHIYKGLQPDWTSIPYGRPLANQGFRVLDSELRDCPEWAIGELYITGQGLAIEYFNDPEMTNARFFEHPRDGQRLYRTGDLGRYLPGGEIEFLGREDNQVKIRGHRIELGEIESALQQHASVSNAKVVLEGKEEERALIAFVEPAVNKDRNTDKESQYFQKMTAGIEEQASIHINGLNRESVEEAMHNLDTAVFYSMLRAMHNMDFFHPGKSSTLEEILNSGQILPQNHWLIRRWVALLTDKNLLNQQKDGFQCMVDATEKEENEHWEKATSSWTADMGSAKFIEYIRNNTRALPELLNGTQDPVALLFPEGSDEYVEALYFENAMVNYLNEAICALLARLAEEKQGHLRILEIGAGTGATTVKIIEHLKTYSFDYLFTDVASAFVSAAKSKFSSVANMRFGVYDVDKDYRKQGLAPNSFDVIVAAGVLENSRNIPHALQQIKELVCPNGWFVYTEPTIEHPWILASQAFMMQEPQDELRLLSSYLDRQSWYDLTAELGKGPVFHLPKPEDHISRLGVHLYATQLKNDRTKAEADSIMAFLQKKVPPYMVPSHLQVVDNIPLTNNGKVDVKKLKDWRLMINTHGGVDKNDKSVYVDDLESSLAEMWASALGLPNIERDQNFYECGADSLIMAQMAGKLRDQFSEKDSEEGIPFDTLLREMLNAPTVRDLATFIRSYQQSVKSSPEENHEGVQHENIGAYTNFGGGENGPLRVIFPAGLGTMDCFRPLIEELQVQQTGPILGVSVADTERYCNTNPRQLVEEVAEDYATHLISTGNQQIQIIGYCLGCMTAIEVARRLQESGIEVVDLILIDGHRVPFNCEDKLLIEALYLPNMNISMEQTGFGTLDLDLFMEWFGRALFENNNVIAKGMSTQINGTEALNKLGDLFRKMSTMTLSERFDVYINAMPDKEGQKMPKEMMIRMFKTYTQSFQASSFEPAPYFGDIRYLQAEDDSNFLPGTSKKVVQFWSEVCLGEFSLDTIQGDHYSCIEPPFVKNVANIVGEPLLISHSK